MNARIQWLLEGPSWIQYRVRRDLLDEPDSAPEVTAARQAMMDDIQVKEVLESFPVWPGEVLNSHRSASQPYHRACFLADLGLKQGDPRIDLLAEEILAHQSAEGPFQLLSNYPAHFGGTGENAWLWALCDAPLLVFILVRFGYRDHPAVQRAIDYLTSLVRTNGFPCTVAPQLGKFRGPGRKEDPCPYANLVMLKLLAEIPEMQSSQPAQAAAESQLHLWENRRDSHPYMFYMGTDFTKLKAPLIWYDILHVLEVLSRFPWLRTDSRINDMLAVVQSKTSAEGLYTPESIWTYWKGWEFGQKKVPSRWLTFLILRIEKRLLTAG